MLELLINIKLMMSEPLLSESVAMVESSLRSDAVGDHGEAVGLMQIHPQVIEDVNRRFLPRGHAPFKVADRLDPKKSMEIFDLYTAGWIGLKGLPDGMSMAEAKARTWNGGPNGPKHDATLAYWNRVQIVVAKGKKIERRGS